MAEQNSRPSRNTSERQMQRHLYEPRTPQCALNQSDSLARCGGILVARHWAKAIIQAHIVIRSVETGMVEQIEKLRVVPQIETFSQLKILKDAEVEPALEGPSENIAPRGSESGFEIVADSLSIGCTGVRVHRRSALRHTALTRIQKRNREGGGVEIRIRGVDAMGALQLYLRDRFSRSNRQDRVCDKVVGAEKDVAHRSREISHAERLSGFQHGDPANSPAVHHGIRDSRKSGDRGYLIHVTEHENVRAVVTGVSVR